MTEQEKFYAAQNARANTPPSKWDTLAKLGAAFGPVALGAAGLGLQAANRPERNPLEDELLRARIASSGQQDALAKERLAFEKENAARMLEAQMAMQAAMLESKKPGGQANIDALLKGNPQRTGLASGGGSPEFLALVEQIAQTDIGELRRQADQQKAQAMEMAARQGINPANIIAEVEQRFLQESAKARANARNVLIAQMQPGVNVFNSVGGLFGNLFQTPSAWHGPPLRPALRRERRVRDRRRHGATRAIAPPGLCGLRPADHHRRGVEAPGRRLPAAVAAVLGRVRGPGSGP
jgi:hypothetical protein